MHIFWKLKMSSKRAIRLKEFHPSTRFIRIPTSDYYKSKPKLKKNNFYYFHTDEDGFIYNTIEKSYSRDLIILGGSSIENLFVDTNKKIITHLEENLKNI